MAREHCQCIRRICRMLVNLCMSRFLNTNQLNRTFMNRSCGNGIYFLCHSKFNGFHNPVNCHLTCKRLYFPPLNRICIIFTRLNDINRTIFKFCLFRVLNPVISQFFSQYFSCSFHNCDTSDYKRSAAFMNFFFQHCLHYCLRSYSCRISHCYRCDRFKSCFAHSISFPFVLFYLYFVFFYFIF